MTMVPSSSAFNKAVYTAISRILFLDIMEGQTVNYTITDSRLSTVTGIDVWEGASKEQAATPRVGIKCKEKVNKTRPSLGKQLRKVVSFVEFCRILLNLLKFP